MYNLKMRDEFVKNFFAGADANYELVCSYGSVAESMKNDDPDMVRYLINKFKVALSSLVPAELDVPEVSVYTNMNGDDNCIKTIDLTLRNKNSSSVEFKFKKQVVYSEDVFDIIAGFLKMSWAELITDAMIRANLEEVNAMFAKIGEEAGNSFKVKVVSPLGRYGHKVAEISDDEIIYVADETRILDMDDILIFCEPNENLPQEAIDAGYKDTVARFAKAQTTPQFVGVHEPTVGYICDISKLVKPLTIIKKVYSKNALKLKKDVNKDIKAYFNNGEVFSVVSATPEGRDVVLKPFNIDTLEVVDFDVLAAI